MITSNILDPASVTLTRPKRARLGGTDGADLVEICAQKFRLWHMRTHVSIPYQMQNQGRERTIEEEEEKLTPSM